MVYITEENFEAEVLKSEVPVLLDFFATWCGPCKMLAPVLEQVEAEVAGSAKVVKCDVDKAPELSRKFGVMSIPTLIVFRNGEAVSKAVGVRGKADLKKMLGL